MIEKQRISRSRCGELSAVDCSDGVITFFTKKSQATSVFMCMWMNFRQGVSNDSLWRETRTLAGGGQIQMTCSYDAAGRPTINEYNNGSKTVFGYCEEANCLSSIRHENATGQAILQMAYTYKVDGLVESITETDEVSVPNETITANLTYAYDNRNRLTRETRLDSGGTGVDPVEYDLWYTYDLGGNCLSKIAKNPHNAGQILETTTFDYDITDSNDGGQHNNRLLHSTKYSGTTSDPVAEERWYSYGPNGEATRLVRRLTGETTDRAYWLYYDSGANLRVSVSGEGLYHTNTYGNWVFTGPWNEQTQKYDPVVYLAAAEYRQDTGRQRYLVRPLDPNNDFAPMPGAQWRDYDGETIYDDYIVNDTGELVQGTQYLAGVGYHDPADGQVRYSHGDQIGSSRAISGPQAAVSGRKLMTAFGEPVQAGDELLDLRGSSVRIQNVLQEKLSKPVQVYNLTVEDEHTYFVEPLGCLVHNTSC